MKRRRFVETLAASAALTGKRMGRAAIRQSPAASQQPFALEDVPVATLQEWMTSGRTTARRLVDQYAARIAALDQRGPRLNHVLQLNPDARAIADQLDAERRAGRVRGPLHGIPVLIKDNIATADQMETTAGSLALLGVKPPRDSFVARRLRDAGGVILGDRKSVV